MLTCSGQSANIDDQIQGSRDGIDEGVYWFLDGQSLSTEDVIYLVKNPEVKLAITSEVAQKISDSRALLDTFVKDNRVIYGVNTSLGGFIDWLVPADHAQELQENLIAAVATNVGSYLEDDVVRAAILARLNSLARGTSGISLENFDKLLCLYNSEIVPCIPSKGSLGASGDLGPLACIALVATGKWKARYRGKILSGSEALKSAKLEPMKLSYKEGLSLINGTSVMAGMAALLVEQAIALVKIYDVISCLTFEGLQVKKKPFNPIVHSYKPHRGQLQTANNIWMLLNDSNMVLDEAIVERTLQGCLQNTPVSVDAPIEDAYSIRCTPHIIGPIRDSLKWIQSIINNELNSSNDNPLILPEYQDVFHNGHFHGQYIAMAMDHLAICLTTLSNLSDRRIDRFMDKHHNNKLPAFLCVEKPGIRFGLMGGQFMATSVTAENRSLCHPVSIQSLTSTGDFQDIVSLGLVAARRAQEIYNNTLYVIAFELMCGAQAADIRDSSQLSTATRVLRDNIRAIVPLLSSNECLTDYLEGLAMMLREGKILFEVEKTTQKIAL